ncbi:MAG: hypothetical protein U0Z44_05645 [Kouleothrix sp.]
MIRQQVKHDHRHGAQVSWKREPIEPQHGGLLPSDDIGAGGAVEQAHLALDIARPAKGDDRQITLPAQAMRRF